MIYGGKAEGISVADVSGGGPLAARTFWWLTLLAVSGKVTS